MTDHGSGPDKPTGSRLTDASRTHSGPNRHRDADKQLHLLAEDADSAWRTEAYEALRRDLARLQFRRASELHDGIRAHREGQR